MKYGLSFFFSAFLLALAGCGKPGVTGAVVDDAFRGGIPSDAQTLLSIDLDKLKASGLYRRYERELDLPVFNEMAKRAGLDPRRDVRKLLIVWDGKHALLLAQGSFSSRQIEEKLAAGGAQRISHKNFILFTQGADSVAFPEKGIAIAAATDVVRAELDLRAAHGGAVPAELQERLTEIPADSQIWAASRGGLPAANFPLRGELDSALSNITAFVDGTSLGLRFDNGSHMRSRILCKSPEGAQRVNDALRGLIGLARLSTNDNELDLLRMWDAVSITKEQQAVRLQADLPADLTEKLIGTLKGRAGGILNR